MNEGMNEGINKFKSMFNDTPGKDKTLFVGCVSHTIANV